MTRKFTEIVTVKWLRESFVLLTYFMRVFVSCDRFQT